MRGNLWLSAIVLALTCHSVNRAGEKEDALSILQTAVKAHGGEDSLAKASKWIRKGSGVLTAFGKDMPFNDVLQAVLPDQMHFSVEAGSAPNVAHIVLIVNKSQGWQDNGSSASELTEERVKEMLEEAHVLEAMTLTPLIKDSANQFSLLKEAKVNDLPAVGILIKNKSHPDLKLYFDKRTGLLVKIGRRAKEGGVDVDKEYLYSDHKEVDGVKMPFKTVEMINNRKYTELNVSSYKFPSKIDEAIFKEPK
ncbi:MAG: hypothetical protein ACJ8FY_08055 [Gemmataceae bacterium]